jgi:PleD family two-component response regulator
VDFITKPIRPAIVKARVQNHMDLKIKTDMLERLSMVDSLTDMPNRRFFDDYFAGHGVMRTGNPNCFRS